MDEVFMMYIMDEDLTQERICKFINYIIDNDITPEEAIDRELDIKLFHFDISKLSKENYNYLKNYYKERNF